MIFQYQTNLWCIHIMAHAQQLSVYDKMTAVTTADDGQTIEYDGTDT